MKENALEMAKKQKHDLTEKKSADLRDIQVKICAAKTQAEEADAAMKSATETMNLEEYEKAREAKRKAKIAIDMYSSRYAQLQGQQLISEEESDKVIDSLLEYEDQIAERYKADIAGPLKTLNELTKAYRAEVADTEETIRAWSRDIRPNYSTRGTMSRIDPETGERTDRSDHPVAVHQIPYLGCDESTVLEGLLKNNTLVQLTD